MAAMKKPLIVLMLMLLGVMVAWAQSDSKDPFRLKNRKIEVGLAFEAGFANDFLTAGDILQDTMVVDLTKLDKGLKFDMAFAVTPLSFNYNHNDRWGFGIFTGAEASGNMEISGKIITISEANDEKFGVGSAVFVEAGASAFFHIKKFKIKVRPAGYMPLLYTQPSISYTHRNGTNSNEEQSMEANIKYDMSVYTGWSMDKFDGITSSVGVDLGAGVEYPLFSFLDLGADLTHIPIVPASMKDYMETSGTWGLKETTDFLNDEDMFSSDSSDTVYGKGSKTVLRPFKMLAWAEYRPFKNRLLSLIPSLGFSINPLYAQPGALEAGIKARCDLANIFIVTIGTGYEDHLWKNSLDIALNGRAVELDLGVDMRSQSFVNSWKAGGLGLKVGLKFGW